MKDRADIVLYKEGYVESLKVANSYIMQGLVLIDNVPIEKSGDLIKYGSNIRIKGKEHKYVSRGGLKLEKALHEFKIDLSNARCMDIGCSTGGFTDCMLKNGAKKVYSVDVGYGQLDWNLRNNPKVVVMERTNIRNVRLEDIESKLDFISIDVSFISLKLVLPVAKKLLKNGGKIVALIKPQFEAKKEDVGKGGIVRDSKVHKYVIEETIEFARNLNIIISNLSYSPITGATGNIEFLAEFTLNPNYDHIDFLDIDDTLRAAYDRFNSSRG